MIWALTPPLLIFMLFACNRANAANIMTVLVISTIFVLDFPYLPGLNSQRFALLAACILWFASRAKLLKSWAPLYLLILAYVFVTSLIGSIDLQLPDHWNHRNLSFFQTPPIRSVLTTSFFILSASLMLVAYNFSNPLAIFEKITFWLLLVAGIAGGFAIIQITTNTFSTFFNPFYELFTKAVILEGGGLIRLRPSVFVHEPRYFGVAMGIALIFLIVNNRAHFIRLSIFSHYSLLFLFGSMLVFSASLSAVLSIFLGLIFAYCSLLRGNFGVRKVVGIAIALLALFQILMSLDLLIFDRFFMYWDRLAKFRLTGSYDASLAVLAYIEWLRNAEFSTLLFGKGLGNSAYFANSYISQNSMLYEKGFFSSRVNVFDMVGDLGLVGFLLLHLSWFYWLISLDICALPPASRERLKRLKYICFFLIGINLSFVCYTLIWILLGLSGRIYMLELSKWKSQTSVQGGIS